MIQLNEILKDFHSVVIDDGGGSITVDGTVELGAASLAALETINVGNGAGGAAVNIQDGGNSITVDGEVELGAATLAALESITVVATDLDIRNLVFATDKLDVSGSSVTTTPGGFSTWKVSAETVDTTAGGVELVSTPLAGRLRVEIQNLGAQDIWVKEATGVTIANGFKIPKGSSWEVNLDDGANVWAITGTSTSDVRVSEYAA